MIRIGDFVRAIHAAILGANDALMDKNLELLERFFEETGGEEEFQEALDDALAATKDVLRQEGKPGKIALQKVQKAIEELSEALAQKAGKETDSDRARFREGLRARMVTIQYPHQTAEGVVMGDVRVPLITLVPLSMTQVSEVKLRSRLEIEIQDDEVFVSFPGRQPGAQADAEGDGSELGTIASLEITLTPHTGSEGLRKIVEGYEKVLRAQIPN